MKTAAILTIGTEITDGQITDRNSQWMSERLVELGFDVRLHVSMPDDKQQIVEFLRANIGAFDLVIFGGGLGPTSDDLTRFAVAEYLGLPLELHEPSWAHILDRLNKRNITVRDTHKSQALIPAGGRALSNSAGSAPGIHIPMYSKNYFLVPGPPRELQAIWEEHVNPFLKLLAVDNPRKLRTWKCTGIAESEIAHITDTFFKDKPFVLKIGYRLIRKQPEDQGWFVEVKIWYTDTAQSTAAFVEFEKIIGNYLASSGAI